jgi:putative membrane protein
MRGNSVRRLHKKEGLGLSRWTWAYLGLVLFSLAGSFASRRFAVDPGPIAPVAAAATLGLGFVAALRPYVRSRRSLAAVFGVVMLGAAVEMLGVATGFPFGPYDYTDRWWPAVPFAQGYFPLQVPFAWALVVGASYLTCRRSISGPWAVVLGALQATLLDVVMEPTMVHALGYWRWRDGGPLPGGVPLSNAAGWFGTSLLGAGILSVGGADGEEERVLDPTVVLAGHLTLVLGIGAFAA